MIFDGAVIKEQGVTFGIVVVKPHVLSDAARRDQLIRQASRLFGGIPTVLVARQSGRARYYGRPVIVRFMARVPMHAIPWKRYRLGNAA